MLDSRLREPRLVIDWSSPSSMQPAHNGHSVCAVATDHIIDAARVIPIRGSYKSLDTAP